MCTFESAGRDKSKDRKVEKHRNIQLNDKYKAQKMVKGK